MRGIFHGLHTRPRCMLKIMIEIKNSILRMRRSGFIYGSALEVYDYDLPQPRLPRERARVVVSTFCPAALDLCVTREVSVYLTATISAVQARWERCEAGTPAENVANDTSTTTLSIYCPILPGQSSVSFHLPNRSHTERQLPRPRMLQHKGNRKACSHGLSSLAHSMLSFPCSQ